MHIYQIYYIAKYSTISLYYLHQWNTCYYSNLLFHSIHIPLSRADLPLVLFLSDYDLKSLM